MRFFFLLVLLYSGVQGLSQNPLLKSSNLIVFMSNAAKDSSVYNKTGGYLFKDKEGYWNWVDQNLFSPEIDYLDVYTIPEDEIVIKPKDRIKPHPVASRFQFQKKKKQLHLSKLSDDYGSLISFSYCTFDFKESRIPNSAWMNVKGGKVTTKLLNKDTIINCGGQKIRAYKIQEVIEWPDQISTRIFCLDRESLSLVHLEIIREHSGFPEGPPKVPIIYKLFLFGVIDYETLSTYKPIWQIQ